MSEKAPKSSKKSSKKSEPSEKKDKKEKKAPAKPPPAIAPPQEEMAKQPKKIKKSKEKEPSAVKVATLPRTGKDAVLPTNVHGATCPTCEIVVDLSLVPNPLYAGPLALEEKDGYGIVHGPHLALFKDKSSLEKPVKVIHLTKEAESKKKKSTQWALNVDEEEYTFTTKKDNLADWIAAIPQGARFHPGVTCVACGKTFDFSTFDAEVITRKATLEYQKSEKSKAKEHFCILAAGHLGVYESEEAMNDGEFMKNLIHTPKNHLDKLDTAFKFKETGEIFKAADNQACLDWLGAIHLQNI